MGALGFIIFGTKWRTKEHGPTYPIHCPNCTNDVTFHLVKDRRWLHMFWIPLIPLSAEKSLVCPTCGAAIGLDKQDYKSAKELSKQANLYSEDEISETEFAAAVQDFDAAASFLNEGESEQTQLELGEGPELDESGKNKICPECGAKNTKGAMYCVECREVIDERVKK